MGGGWLTWAWGKRQRGLAGHKHPRVNIPQKRNSTGSKRNNRKMLLKHEEASLNVGWAGLKASLSGDRDSPNLSGPSGCTRASPMAGPGPWGLLHCPTQGRTSSQPMGRGTVCFQDGAGLQLEYFSPC